MSTDIDYGELMGMWGGMSRDADLTGHGSAATVWPVIGASVTRSLRDSWFYALYESSQVLSSLLDNDSVVLDANVRCVEGCGIDRSAVLGHHFWDAQWWSPDPVLSKQVRQWCDQALSTGRSVEVTTPYFLADRSRRMVQLSVIPLRDDETGDRFLVASGIDVTEALDARREREQWRASTEDNLHALSEARRLAVSEVTKEHRLGEIRLREATDLSRRLASATTANQVARLVAARGPAMLDADGGVAVLMAHEERAVVAGDEFSVNALGDALGVVEPLMAQVARDGERVVRNEPDLTGLLASADTATGPGTLVILPLTVDGRVLGSLAALWHGRRPITDSARDLLEIVAAQCSEALERVRVTRAWQDTTDQLAHLAAGLQRRLLTLPPTPPGLEVVARYLPAARHAQIGGDWYDCFDLPDGSAVLSVGDVGGHGGDAAAAMAELRNLLRGLAARGALSPVQLLGQLDAALARLDAGATLASALVAVLDALGSGPSPGTRRMRWSNAGHLPPVLRQPDGQVEILETPPDLLLGFDPATGREERSLDLAPGTTLLLYTDGLVERPREHLDDGLRRLARELADAPAADELERTADHLVEAMLAETPSDDVALLLVRTNISCARCLRAMDEPWFTATIPVGPPDDI